MAIEILLPTTRTLGGATRAVLEQLLGPGFLNIDPAEGENVEVEVTDVDMSTVPYIVPAAVSAPELGDRIKSNREIVRVRIPLRLGHFLLFPGFVVLCRPDAYEEFIEDERARNIIGRESLELANAFRSPELIVCGDAATDFLGTEVTKWGTLAEVLTEEEIPHRVIAIPK